MTDLNYDVMIADNWAGQWLLTPTHSLAVCFIIIFFFLLLPLLPPSLLLIWCVPLSQRTFVCGQTWTLYQNGQKPVNCANFFFFFLWHCHLPMASWFFLISLLQRKKRKKRKKQKNKRRDWKEKKVYWKNNEMKKKLK